jgi:hypothetical protein
VSFDTPSKSSAGDAATPMSVQSVDHTGRLFPPLETASKPTIRDEDDPNLRSNANNAVTIHNPALSQLNSGQYNLDPNILNLPLGTLLSTPAGAQFLATLGQSAASFLVQPDQNPGSPSTKPHLDGQDAGNDRFTDASVSAVQGNAGLNLQPYIGAGQLDHGLDTAMPGFDADTSWMSDVVPQAEGLPDHLAQPFADSSMLPVNGINTSSLAEGDAIGQATDFDWSDPAVKALLLQAFENHNQQQSVDQTGVGPNVFTNDDQYDDLFIQDPTIDFDGLFNNASNSNGATPPVVETATPTDRSTTNSNAGDLTEPLSVPTTVSLVKPGTPDELFAGPTRKKRKTDQRES